MKIRGLFDLVRRRKTETPSESYSDFQESSSPEQPPALVPEQCPCVDDFGVEASMVTNLDSIEGFRMILSRIWSSPERGDTTLSHALFLGTYPLVPSRAETLQALLKPQSLGALKGGGHWVTSLRHISPNATNTVQTRYSSQTGTAEGRLILSPWKHGSLQFTALTSDLGGIKSLLARLSSDPKQWRSSLQYFDTSGSAAVVSYDHVDSKTYIGGRIAFRDDLHYNIGFARRIHRRFWGGTELNYFAPYGAVASTYGVKYKADNTILSGTMTVGPNFEKTLAEGIKESAITAKITAVQKINSTVTAAAEVEAPLTDLQMPRLRAKAGYEWRFSQARVSGSIDQEGVIKQTIEDASGLSLSGMIDFRNDNYKFGFGYDIAKLL